MKKILLLILLTTTAPMAVFAYSTDGSGACSFHSGVNCSAGAHSDGSTICNDGWVDSSVKYYEVQECKLNLDDLCPTPHVSGYSEYSSCDRIKDECTRYDEQRNQICLISGRSSDSENCQPSSCEEFNICRDEVNRNNKLIKSYDQCIDSAVKVAEAEFERQKEMNSINDGLLQDALKEASCGSFAYYSKDNDKCYCDEGYEAGTATGQCVLKKIEVPSQPVLTIPTPVKEYSELVPVPVAENSDLDEEKFDTTDSSLETERTQDIQGSLPSSSPETADVEIPDKIQEDGNQNGGIFTKIINFLSRFKFW